MLNHEQKQSFPISIGENVFTYRYMLSISWTVTRRSAETGVMQKSALGRWDHEWTQGSPKPGFSQMRMKGVGYGH